MCRSKQPRTKAQYRKVFTQQLADLMGCEPRSLSPTTTRSIATRFLGVPNSESKGPWFITGPNGTVAIKIPEQASAPTGLLIEAKLAGVGVFIEVAD